MQGSDGPDVKTMVAVDRQYRLLAEQGRLPLIAPKRFNPECRGYYRASSGTAPVLDFHGQ